nr:hypothetical protein [Candidatus Sigynarchaeum springense]MDO8116430.1 hypothetical protein [Candidatus Sigynarchaeota archaeon]
MITSEKADKHKDSKLVQFWVKEHLLARWDEFCEKYSINRTSFLVQAANHYMLNFDRASKSELETTTLETDLARMQQQMERLLKEMEGLKGKSEQLVHDPHIHARITSYLKKHGWTSSDDLFPIIGINHSELLDVLVQMKKDGIIIANKDAEWNVK